MSHLTFRSAPVPRPAFRAWWPAAAACVLAVGVACAGAQTLPDPATIHEAGGAEVLQRPIVAGVAGQLTRTTENGVTVTRLVFVKGKITVLVTATGAVTADELAALADSLRGLD